jgi:glycosyltransferase involved in cell wall biosynthesis
MKVSVVIPAYNEATYIDRLLEALTHQTFESFEVIVSDADSKDGTEEVVKDFADRLDARLVQSPPRGPAAGRNVGAKLARGDWLLFLDADDDIDDPEFIATLVGEAEKHGWQTATARQKNVDANLAEALGGWLNYHYTKLLAHTKHPVSPGWCILTRRELFEKCGGFNENIHFGEDYDYVSRAGHAGFGFVESTYYYVDLRRARSEGFKFFLKGLGNEIYRHTHHYNLEGTPINYDFGHHQKRGK